MNACISIDWLTMSFPALNCPDGEKDFLSIWEILGVPRDKFSPNWSPMGYSVCLQYEGILVMWNTPEEDERREKADNKAQRMGLCVSVSGSGCQFLNELHANDGEFPFSSILANFFSLPSAKCTRIDIACDDLSENPDGGALKFRDFVDVYKYCSWVGSPRNVDLDMPKRNERSKIRYISKRSKTSIKDCFTDYDDEDIYKARVFYLGRRGCNFLLRVYDKLLERQEKGVEIDSNIKHWVRLEMELRKVIADTMARNIMLYSSYSDIDNLVSAFLNGKVRFINFDSDNLYTCSTVSWWKNFISTTNFLFCSIPHEEPTIAKKHRWVEDQVSASLAMLYQAFGMERIQQYIRLGLSKMTNSQQSVVRDFLDLHDVEYPHVNGDLYEYERDLSKYDNEVILSPWFLEDSKVLFDGVCLRDIPLPVGW